MPRLSASTRTEASRLISQHIDALKSRVYAECPDLDEQLSAEARKKAIGSVRGLEKLIAEKIALEEKIRLLIQQVKTIEDKIEQKMPLADLSERDSRYSSRGECARKKSYCAFIAERATALVPKVRERHPIGKKLDVIDRHRIKLSGLVCSAGTEEELSRVFAEIDNFSF